MVPTLRALELELYRALGLLEDAKKTFRVERVPLCFMADFAYASTETRRIVKNDTRSTYFLDDRGLIDAQESFYPKAPRCRYCSLKKLCAGLYMLDEYYSSEELCPVFMSPDNIKLRILGRIK
ncbi:MAG: hypothetical protein WC881_00755 [Elusimicrobiota bacterium]|jgi:hypothetical protein